MKKHYVYALMNGYGAVEYVGETARPKARFDEHVKYKTEGQTGKGMFLGRTDLTMEILKEFDTRGDAWDYQCEIQKEFGIITDREKLTRKHTNDSREKIGNASKGRWQGKKHSEESILKMREARKKYWENK